MAIENYEMTQNSDKVLQHFKELGDSL